MSLTMVDRHTPAVVHPTVDLPALDLSAPSLPTQDHQTQDRQTLVRRIPLAVRCHQAPMLSTNLPLRDLI